MRLYDKLQTNANRLIDVSNSIYTIYENLYNATIDDDKKTHAEYIDYLKLAFEVEHKIYNELNLKDRDDYDYFLYIIYGEVEKRNYDEEKYGSIINRIENYFNYTLHSRPTLTTNLNEEDNIDENVAKIFYRINYQYLTTLFNELDKSILNEKNEYIKNRLIHSKYNMIFTNKELEFILLNNKEIKTDNGKEKLLRCHHQKKVIEKTYERYILDVFNESVNSLLNITDNSLKEKETYQKLNLLTLKSILKQLEKDEIISLYNNFYTVFLSNAIEHETKTTSTNSIQKIKDTFKELFEEKDINNVLIKTKK